MTFYNRLLARYPLPTKMATSAFLWSAGDIICQAVNPRSDRQYDFFSTARLAFFGGVIFTPLASSWYGLLARSFPSSSMPHMLYKVGLDQSIFAFSVLSSLYVYTALTEGKRLTDGFDRAKDNIWVTMKANWMWWPAIQAINFAVIPVPYQVLVVNCASIPWNTFLAYRTAKATADSKQA